MRLPLALVAALAAAPAFAQGPPAPPPAPTPVGVVPGEHPYRAYRCEGGLALFRADVGPEGIQEVWLDGDAGVLTLPYSREAGAYTDGTYTAGVEPEVYVRRSGVAVRERCTAGSGEPADRLQGRPGVRIAWARADPQPFTTYLRRPDGGGVWVGGDLLVLDSTVVRAVTTRADLAPGWALVDVRLTPEATALLEGVTTEQLNQPLAFLSDGALLIVPIVREPIRGGAFVLSVEEAEAARIAATLAP
jgi:hypothetical protein